MSENSALDTLEMAQEWVKGGIVEGIDITIDEYMAGQGIVGPDAIQAEINKITQAATKQAIDAIEIDPTLVSTSGNTNAASLKVTEWHLSYLLKKWGLDKTADELQATRICIYRYLLMLIEKVLAMLFQMNY